MIVRPAHSAATRYTHDEEAVISEWRRMREFAGVSVEIMQTWIEEARNLSWDRNYWHLNGTDWFLDERVPTYGRRDPEIILVSLWDVEAFTDYTLKRRGFSCVICGARSAFDKIGRIYQYYWNLKISTLILEQIERRQGLKFAPPLACRECAIDLPLMLTPFISNRLLMQTADRLIGRIVPL